MVKHRLYNSIALGKARDALQWAKELDETCRREVEGHPGFRVWLPVTGEMNVLILESEYRDMAEFARLDRAFSTNSNVMDRFRSGVDLLEPGSRPEVVLEESAFDLA